MNKVKFSVFSDLHHDIRWCGDTDERLDFILERAKKENVDFVVHLGDLCHNANRAKDLIDKYNHFEIPAYHVLGNHDMDELTMEETVAHYKMPGEYYYFDKNGFRFIALNANYLRIGGEDIPYSEGNYFKYGQYRDYVSQKQVKWLEEVVMASPYPMIVMSHGSLQLEDYQGGDGMKNREDIQNIFRKAHKNGKRILLCLNGHHHVDYMRIYEHTCYLAINSATMYWVPDCTHQMFPKEFDEAHTLSKHTVIYNDPIHAVITLCDDGTIEVEGMESTFFCGIDKEAVSGNNCRQGIKCTAKVMTEKIRLPMEV